MHRLHPSSLFIIVTLAAACGETPLGPEATEPSLHFGKGRDRAGAVYVMSNATAGNDILVFSRSGRGLLDEPQSVPTGGLGTGGGLGNQGALVFARGDQLLYAVNAGSDDISGFRVHRAHITRIGIWPSNGDLPISLAVHRNLLYVLNDGTDPNITGFRIEPHGSLDPIPGSTRMLDGTPDAAQVGFSPDGSRLVVTAKATNQLLTYPVQSDGTLGAEFPQGSAGATPFGFAFARRGTLIVSEAFGGAPDASVLSSYRSDGAGWTAVSPLAATTETAACWVVVTPNGRFTYTTNTGSASVTGFAVRHDGSLRLLDADGVTAVTGAGPIDLDLIRSGRFLYTLNSGASSISIFRIRWDGSLENLGEIDGLPTGANGLVAR